MLVCKNVTYRYPGSDRDSLHGVNLIVSPGERLAVMGANGSGKSTLARLIAGLAAPTEGAVEIGGSEGVENAAVGDHVGILFQNPDNQMVSVLVDKEVAFALENRGMSVESMKPRVEDTLTAFRIDHLARRLTMELSGGEKQRVALAGVMVDRPKVLLLDEPDAFLDQKGRGILAAELQRMRSEVPDLIEIRITQSQSVARSYPRLCVLKAGQVVADGEPDCILDDDALAESCGLTLKLFEERASERAFTEPTVIHVDGVSFAFEREAILKDVSFDIQSGEIVALTGPTGTGKSTLALLLSGLIEPDRGVIRLEHPEATNGVAAANGKSLVGLVLQQPERQFFLSTCNEEIDFGPANFDQPLSPDRIGTCLREVGLDPEAFGERDPLSLSVGENRRLAFAVMLALGPRFLVFDEPTAGLDMDGVSRFVMLARREAACGRGIVVITHEGSMIERLADRVLHLPGDGSVKTCTADQFLGDDQLRASVSPIDTM
jgi:energy-coupling factor transport system ATP-binding protein